MHGQLRLRFGLGWAKSHSFHTGQTPVLRYNRQLMEAILWDRLPIAGNRQRESHQPRRRAGGLSKLRFWCTTQIPHRPARVVAEAGLASSERRMLYDRADFDVCAKILGRAVSTIRAPHILVRPYPKRALEIPID